jgi:peptidylprolyl isomerase
MSSRLLIALTVAFMIALIESHKVLTKPSIVKRITASIVAIAAAGSLNLPVHAASIAPLADVGLKEFLVKDGKQFLRLELPIGKECKLGVTDEGKLAQEYLELVKLRFEQVGFTNPAAWVGALKDLNQAESILTEKRGLLIDKAINKEKAIKILDTDLKSSLEALKNTIREQDISNTLLRQDESASYLADLRALQLTEKKLPYTIPEEYAALPRLLGRANIEIKLSDPKGFRDDTNKKYPDITLLVTVDGYHAPLTAGNFVDLVNRKHFDGLSFNKVEELSVQTGDKSDSKGDLRTVPLELFYKKDTAPTYGYTSDEDNRATETMALPFQSYGAVGMARNNEDADSGSSQVFFLKWKQALIAPGRNTLDGFYSCFGYVVNNQDYLKQITPNTKIVSAKVVSGADNLVVP